MDQVQILLTGIGFIEVGPFECFGAKLLCPGNNSHNKVVFRAKY